MSRSICLVPRCPEFAVHRGKCATHRQSTSQRGYGVQHQEARATLGATLPVPCGYGCGVVLTAAGPWVAAHVRDGDASEGWIASCVTCNERAKHRPMTVVGTPVGPQAPRRYARAPSSVRVIHVVGQPGSGKTTLARALGDDLGLPVLDIADMPGHLTDPHSAWSALADRITAACIVETVGTSGYEDRFWPGETVTIVVSAPEEVRRQRLSAREEAAEEGGYVRRLLRVPVYEGHADHRWDGTQLIAGVAYSHLVGGLRRRMTALEVGFA